MRLLLAVILAITACSGSGPAARPSATPPATPTPLATAGAMPAFQTVTYCDGGGQPLAMDMWAPSPGSRLPAPAALHVHGGGWTGGSRSGGGYLGDLAPQLSQRGFLVASIDYRLAPANPWPDQIVDVRCAVRFLRANAARFGIDPQRIGAWGESAGGHLVSLLGTHTGADRVQAVVDLFGPADLSSGDWPPATQAVLGRVFGDGVEVRRAASPVEHVAPGDPPFLILQGDHDTVVPATQSVELAGKLQAVGVPVTLVIVMGGRHGLIGAGMDPVQPELEARIVRFLVEQLGAGSR